MIVPLELSLVCGLLAIDGAFRSSDCRRLYSSAGLFRRSEDYKIRRSPRA